MRAEPTNAVHTVTAPEITARVARPVCVVLASIRIEGLTVARGGLPAPTRSIVDTPDRVPAPMRANLAAVTDGRGPLCHHRRATLHP